jgi:hypothetical protein
VVTYARPASAVPDRADPCPIEANVDSSGDSAPVSAASASQRHGVPGGGAIRWSPIAAAAALLRETPRGTARATATGSGAFVANPTLMAATVRNSNRLTTVAMPN